MSVDAASTTLAPSAAHIRSRDYAWTGAVVVSLTVALALRLLLVWRRATPEYFPDEYLYSALGRSFSQLHTTIRGGPAHFPAVLQPLLTAPAWRVGDVATGYRLVQAIESVFFTLAAVPVYVLARRLLALPRWIAAYVAAIALLVPDGVYSGFMLADPIAYPIAMAAVVAAVVALARPCRRTQLVFLVLAALASAARIQFVVLPLCYLGAALLLGWREGSIRRTAREQREPALLLVLLGAAALAAGPSHVAGYYRRALHLHPHPLADLVSAGHNLLVLGYASGWILVPGALLGAGLALWRPRTRLEGAFGALVPMLTAALLVEATVFGGTGKVHERYAFYLIPVAAVSFGLYAARGWPLRRAYVGILAALFLLTTQPFLAGWAQVGSDDHAPFLYAVHWLELRIGNGNATLAISVAAAVLALVAGAAARWPRPGTPIVLTAATVVCAVATLGAVAFDNANSRGVAMELLPADHSWVDHAHAGPVTLVAGYNGSQGAAEAQLFWNRSIDRVALLQGALPTDGMSTNPILVDANGTLEVHRRPLHGALLLDEYGGTLVPRGGTVLGRSREYTLWRPSGRPRLALYMPGRFHDGLLAPRSEILAWPARAGRGIAGWVTFRVTAATQARPLRITIQHATRTWHVRIAPGHTASVRLPACSSGPWLADLNAPPAAQNLFRFSSGRATVPRIVPDAAACASR